jgi:hypothetical protein
LEVETIPRQILVVEMVVGVGDQEEDEGEDDTDGRGGDATADDAEATLSKLEEDTCCEGPSTCIEEEGFGKAAQTISAQ